MNSTDDLVIARQRAEWEKEIDQIRGSDLASRTLRLSRYLQGFSGAYTWTRCTPHGDFLTLLDFAPLNGESAQAHTGQKPALTAEQIEAIIKAQMREWWDEICDDTGCHPLDIRRHKTDLWYESRHWTDAVAKYSAQAILSQQATDEEEVLTCDVKLPPATTIRAGCTFDTLRLAMRAEFRPRHFPETAGEKRASEVMNPGFGSVSAPSGGQSYGMLSGCMDFTEPTPIQGGEVKLPIPVWDVREVEDCGHRGMKGYEVLLPDGTWTDVAAHNPEDAIATANLDWRAAQQAAAEARAQVVAWLRDDACKTRDDLSRLHAARKLTIAQTAEWEVLIALKSGIADAIERGDHLAAMGKDQTEPGSDEWLKRSPQFHPGDIA